MLKRAQSSRPWHLRVTYPSHQLASHPIKFTFTFYEVDPHILANKPSQPITLSLSSCQLVPRTLSS